jgi:hypothetical protein
LALRRDRRGANEEESHDDAQGRVSADGKRRSTGERADEVAELRRRCAHSHRRGPELRWRGEPDRARDQRPGAGQEGRA